MRVLIDDREKDANELLTRLKANEIDCEIRRLALGDYCLVEQPVALSSTETIEDTDKEEKNKEDSVEEDRKDKDTAATVTTNTIEETGERIVAVFEHKCPTDLRASIKDGRYRDQFQRLSASGVPRVFYVISGSLGILDGQSQLAAVSALLHMSFAGNGFSVIPCPGGTAHVAHMLTKAVKYAQEGDGGSLRYDNFARAGTKRKIVDQRECYLAQLQCLHGVSLDKARAIADVYPSMSALLNALETGQQSEKDLAALQVGKRKLGPVIAKRMIESLFTEPLQSSTPSTKRAKSNNL